MSTIHSALIAVIGAFVAILGLIQLVNAFGHSLPIFTTPALLLWGFLQIATGVGFLLKQGWAFTLVSLGLLGAFLYQSIVFILAFDSADRSILGAAVPLLLTIAAIAYLSRWNTERHFRPHQAHH